VIFVLGLDDRHDRRLRVAELPPPRDQIVAIPDQTPVRIDGERDPGEYIGRHG
jgi:hypothetical protein